MSNQAFRRLRGSSSKRHILLAGASVAAMLLADDGALARSLTGGSAGFVSAPSLASEVATQTAAQAAIAARKTQDSLARAARAMQDMQSVQAAARAAAAARQTSLTAPVAVPDGLGAGGLLPNMSAGWSGANAPAESPDKTQVGIRQTQAQAILNWQSFNVGARTTLTFDQQGNAGWVALNRVSNATAPSQILGNIKADGQVYIINQSGIIFGGNSQINVGALIASTAGITDAQFTNAGIYSVQSGATYMPSFTAAGGKVVVEAGAAINTRAPSSVTSGGGFVLLIGSGVENSGSIGTPKGQTILAAGDDFVIRPGFGTQANTTSTTRGNEIAPVMAVGSSSGAVTNSGLIFAQQGDITLAGRSIAQNGALIATTSVNTRGTIHLLNSASDSNGSITLGAAGLMAVLPELDSSETALDSQRDALIAASTAANFARAGSATGAFDNLSLLADRQDQSRVEIVTGGMVTFKGGSYTAAQGGQIAVSAGTRVVTEDGAVLDASGIRNVALAMASNNVKVNVQGNELRDSPQNRDSDVLKSNDVWIDVRSLTLVPAGTGGYASDRYYTAGGLLEVGGYLGTTAHKIGEWTAVGGSITLSAPEVIAQKGATFDISGGSLDYAAGWIRSTNLIGSDGRRYSVDQAPADMSFVSFAGGFVRAHNIQGKQDDRLTEIWTTVFDRGRTSLRWEDGYTVGRDAGRLILSTPTSVFEGTILADTIEGDRQGTKRAAGITDGYKVTQTTVAQNGTLALGQYDGRGLVGGADSDVVFGNIPDITAGRDPETATYIDRKNTAWFDVDRVNAAKLGGIDIASKRSITVDAPLQTADGGVVTFKAPNVTLSSDLTVHSGTVALGNIMSALLAGNGAVQSWALTDAEGNAQVTIGEGAIVDLTGAWSDLATTGNAGRAVLNGGTLTVATTGSITLAQGSVVDVSSGATHSVLGKFTGGRGGSVSLITNDFENLPTGGFNTTPREARLILNGAIYGYGFTGGGTVTLNAAQKIVIGGGAAMGDLQLDPALFASGFSAYDVTGIGGVTISDGTQIAPVVPVYRLTDAGAAEVWLPQLTTSDALGRSITRRAGADITFAATNGDFTLGKGAVITVDPGHNVNIYAYNQTTIDGTIIAKGGSILVGQAQLFPGEWRQLGGNGLFSLTRSIWIGSDAVLDVSGYALTVTDIHGRTSGTVADGGSIALGGANNIGGDAFVVIRPGAILDASGTSATIDLIDGNTAMPVLVASDGGSIALSSNNGIYNDGTLRAAAGGAGAWGGTLSMTLISRLYAPSTGVGGTDIPGAVPEGLRKLRNITITQQREVSGLGSGVLPGQADASLVVGTAAISAEQIAQGGFGSVALKTADMFVFKGDVNLVLPRSLTLSGGLLVVNDSTPDIAVALAAPYVKIDGFTEVQGGDRQWRASINQVVMSHKPSPSSFSVDADLLDITGGLRFGSTGAQGSGYLTWDGVHTQDPGIRVDYAGFAQVNLTSHGDIRFGNGVLNATGNKIGGEIRTGGDLTLTAAQIYPMSNATVSIYAGLVSVGPNDVFDTTPHTITIRRSGSELPQMPAAVFGSLGLSALVIDQGGVLRAPLGIIGFNNGVGGVAAPTSAVTFRAGSITSASAGGLIMPLGGTADSVSYDGGGKLINLAAMMNGDSIFTKISVAGNSIVAEPGALLDVSGGGTLTGAGFVSGRGGSVDVLKTALVNANPAYAKISAKADQVFAIMPGYASAYAPLVATNGAGDPGIGRQITIPAGVPGLPAGTYTLLPSSYALLPGAFRVELGASSNISRAPLTLANGSTVTSAVLGIANSSIRDALPTQIILSSGTAVRSYSQYNETSYADFARTQAAQFDNVRPRLPDDGGVLEISLGASTGAPQLTFAGTAKFDPVNDGIAGSLMITSSAQNGIIDITAPGAAPIIGHTTISSADINAFHAASLFIGGGFYYNKPGSTATTGSVVTEASGVTLIPKVVGVNSAITFGDGAELRAGQVFLIGASISVAGSAVIDTRGQSKAGLDSSLGYLFQGGNFLAVTNGRLNFLPPSGTGSMTIASGASLLTEGGIVIGAPGSLAMGDVNFGARYLSVTLNTINAGDPAALAAAQAAGVLPTGWTLNQAALDRLLRPSSTAGVPALEQLALTVGGSINLFGNVTLDARSQSAAGVEFVLNTPAIYGLGTSAETSTIIADRLVWNGIRTGYFDPGGTGTSHYGVQPPAAITPNGAGTGAGNLVLQAQDVTFGYGSDSRPTDGVTLGRIAVGFANVAINATNRIAGNSDGTLSIGQSKDSSGKLIGGNLTLTAPLLTAEAGATIDYSAGGALRAVTPAGVAPTDTSVVADQGGTLSFKGDSVFVGTALALPSGKLTLTATGDIIVGADARIDLAGRAIAFYDVTKYGWGGDLVMQSKSGSIIQTAGALIDVSAAYNQAGSIAAVADGGAIALNGTLRGSSAYEAQSGSIALRAASLGDFAALNAMLSQTGFFASRAFVLKQGDLVVGDGVRAHNVSISVDNGSLTVTGTIDASGAKPGNIRLAARDDLTLASSSVLDTHSTVLQTDSYGAPIQANNTAHVELTSASGWVNLAPGATIDMRSADGAARGKLEINAPRLGTGSSATGPDAPANAIGDDIAISASGPLNIRGAASIAVNGFATYTNAPADPDAAHGQIIDQAWLDLIHQDSTAFYNSALANTNLQNRLAGLKNINGAEFHLRPGVTIASATPDGNLTTKGDLDFSNYRYGTGADTLNHSGLGEVGVINFRAGGTLTVKGSINDGFTPPPVSPDALVTLFSGTLGGDYTVTTAGVTLSGGWTLGGTGDDGQPPLLLPVALPLPQDGGGFYFNWEPTVNHPLPIDIPLASEFTITGSGMPIGGEIRDNHGNIMYRATDVIPAGNRVRVPAGGVLGAGTHDIGAWSGIVTSLTVWPANTDMTILLGGTITQPIQLPVGTVLPYYFALSDITLTGPGDRKVWVSSAMQAPGAQSWSMRLVGGADLAGVDSRALQATTQLANGTGNVVLSDPYTINLIGTGTSSVGVSVVRTGTGSLEILAGGSYRQDSPYGVYTAGTAIAVDGTYNIGRALAADGTVFGSIDNPQNTGYEDTLKDLNGNYLPRMYYTENGGDVLLMAQGDIGGKLKGAAGVKSDSAAIGDWLLRQGGNGQSTGWGISFGGYVAPNSGGGPKVGLAAFSGIGALGGGNVTLRAGGDIGDAGQGVVVAIGGSGRVTADGQLIQTGGGSLSVVAGGNVGTGGNQFVNLRGDTQVATGDFGSTIGRSYGYNGVVDPRQLDLLKNYSVAAVAGGSFAPGDGAVTVRARGDLAMGNIDDPGRVLVQDTDGGMNGVSNTTWFTLWTGRTVVDLMAAGGAASPLSPDQLTQMLPSVLRVAAATGDILLDPAQNGNALMMPSPNGELQLLAQGSVIEVNSNASSLGPLSTSLASIATPFRPAWARHGLVGSGGVDTVLNSNLWAQGSLLNDEIGAGASGMRAIGRLFAFGPDTISDASAIANDGVRSLIYAVNGDISGLRYGEVYHGSQLVGSGTIATDFYRAAKPVDIIAGGDIVNIGGLILHNDPTNISTIAAGGNVIYAGTNAPSGVGAAVKFPAGLQIAGPGTLEITAGKNIYQGSSASIESIGAKVSGDTRPGASVVLQAGVGAGEIGVGQVDWAGFAKLYLDPANRAGTGPLADQPGKAVQTADALASRHELASWLKTRFGYGGDDAGAVDYFNTQLTAEQRSTYPSNPLLVIWLKSQGYKGDQGNALAYYLDRNTKDGLTFTYDGMLLAWLQQNYRYAGDEAGALARFGSLSGAQQRIFLRQVYFAELTAGGREYNDANSTRFHSYLRGRDAIAALFPSNGYAGDITLFSAYDSNKFNILSGSVHTDFGGDIQFLSPGGKVTIGTEGIAPGADAGLITQGAGNIQVYALGSMQLGLSRVMTTFGGDILVWSATGDINAGRGSKTTVIYTPPRRTYDIYGSVALAPQVPSTGAGIATLNPIPDVPPGNIDLIAPLGTIDAGEAGIRVSGNINLAALQVLNAANISVQGTSSGIPTVQAPSISSALSSSNATAATQQTTTPNQGSGNAQPSVIIVEVLGYGGGDQDGTRQPDDKDRKQSGQRQSYDPNSMFQVVGSGSLSREQKSKLTDEENARISPQ